ncbi:MAG TPA: hypothetical protein VGJ22_10300, partial [Anaerolineales bacterium]
MIRALLVLVALISAGCATTGGADEEPDPIVTDAAAGPAADAAASVAAEDPKQPEDSKQQEGEVPLAVAESEQPQTDETPPEVVVQGHIRNRHEAIHDLVTEGQALLRDVELKYVLTGKGKRQTLRGRPVAFALWSELQQEWTVAQLELPRPPLRWKPGRKPLKFLSLTPGIQARHVKGTGAERLMFSFSRDGEPLKVYGRKFPVFDNKLVKRR